MTGTDADGLTEAGRHVRHVYATGSPSVKASTTLPCAMEHTPGRVCLLPEAACGARRVAERDAALADTGPHPDGWDYTPESDPQPAAVLVPVATLGEMKALLAAARPRVIGMSRCLDPACDGDHPVTVWEADVDRLATLVGEALR